MDSPRQKSRLLSDVHITARPRVSVERAPIVDMRTAFSGGRPKNYESDIISKPKSSKPEAMYARFYRQAVATSQKKVADEAQGQVLALQAVAQAKPRPVAPIQRAYAPPSKKKRASAKPVRRAANILIVVAVVMSGVMGAMIYRYHIALQKVEALPLQAAAGGSTEQADAVPAADDTTKVSETKPVASGGGGRVAATTPYTINIPRLKVSASIISVGITKKGAMNVPGNIWQVGWYSTSSTPASNAGVVVMNGHVHGPTLPGVFANLTKVKVGDIITVKDGSGTTYTYKVDSQQTYKAGDATDSMLQSASPDKQGLNLITCTGGIKGDEYQSRLVVFAERV